MARKSSRKTSAKKTTAPAAPKQSPPKAFAFHTVTPEEEQPDGTLLLAFCVPGRPATKKTHQRVVRRGRFTHILPSEQYERYEAHCKPFCEAVWKDLGKPPMDFGVGIKLTIYLDNWVVGDTVGYYQSLGDIAEKYGIIANDMWIRWVDKNTHAIQPPDKENPRVEIQIYRFRHPKETYRADQEAAETRRIERAAARVQKAAEVKKD